MARYQGLNTGVVLYNLARMRESKEWQNYLDKVDFMSFLCQCYSLLMFKLQQELFMTACCFFTRPSDKVLDHSLIIIREVLILTLSIFNAL